MSTVRLFVSYSHRDPQYLTGPDSLLGFLKGLERDEDVEFWTDQRIEGGASWDDEIKARLRGSDIALVLVSQSFLDSPYCTDVEMSAFLKRCRDEGMIIFPVILSPCEWDRHEWIASRQFIPSGNETIEENYTEPGKRKRLYLKIRQELRSAIARVRERRNAPESQPAAAGALPQVERRQVTILRCELVPADPDGTPVDPEDLPEILHELAADFQQVCTQVFNRFEGHIVHTSGGGVTVSFGHPIVHEDDSRRAVRAGLALIETIGSLSARIERELGVQLAIRAGVHTGVVVIDVTSEKNFADRDITTATRVQDLAPVNGIAVSENTRKLIDGFLETEESGAVTVHQETLRVYRIVRDTGFDSRVQAASDLTELVGREEELGLLLDRWTEARRSNGQLVMLQAEAGVGKSRLITEMKARLSKEPHTWIECRCSPYHQNTALFPLTGALEEWLGIQSSDSDEARLAKLEKRLAPYGSSVGQIVPAIAAVLSVPFEHKYPEAALGPAEQKQLTLEVMAQLVIERALEKPAVFVVEDLHWVDPSTGEFLDILVEQAATVPLMIFLTYRPEYAPPPQWLSRPYASQINLDRLDRESVRRMTLALAGGKALPPEVFEEIFAKTEGFPLFVEDLTRMVIESDLLVEHDDRFTLAGPFQSLSIPATLQETLMARLAKLATAKPVAQVGATIGREFVFEMLRAVGGFDDKTLVDELNKLVAAGLLYRRGILSRAKYIFKHALVQEALQQSLLKKQRRQYHKVIAEVLEEKFRDVVEAQPELVAYHYDEAELPAKAIEYWQRAAEKALARSANREALSHARRAIEALADLPDGVERRSTELTLRTIEGPALLALKGYAAPELAACYHRARELCRTLPPTPKFFGVLRGIWANHSVSRLEEAIAIAGELFELAFQSRNEDLLMEGRAALGDTLFWMGRPADSLEQARFGLQTYQFERHHVAHAMTYGEDPSTMFYTYSALTLSLLGRPRESLQFTRAAIDMIDKFTHTHSRAFLIFGVAWNHVQLRDAEQAGHWAQKLVDLAVANHFAFWLPLGHALKAWSDAASGQLAQGAADFALARQQWHATGAGVLSCFYTALLADLFVRAGDAESAAHWVAKGFEGAAACGDRYSFSELHRLEGETHAMRNDDAKALASFAAAMQVARTQEAKLLELRVATSLARLHIRRGEHEAAAAVLAPLLAHFEEETIADVLEAREVYAKVQQFA